MTSTESKEPLVTVRCCTYNQEKFIRQTLDGFVMQQTNFPFEAVVHDDASTDGTAKIVLEYAEKYPDIIKPIIETENQYSKGDGSLSRIMNAHTRGKYVAFCEGDDYWTDPMKLQKQVDFLEKHKECSMVHTGFSVVDENSIMLTEEKLNAKIKSTKDAKEREKIEKTLKRLNISLSLMVNSKTGFAYYKLLATGNYIMTLTTMVHTELLKMIPSNGLYYDYGKFLYLSRKGYVGYIGDITSNYRFTPGSIISNPVSFNHLDVLRRRLFVYEIDCMLKEKSTNIIEIKTFPKSKMIVARVLVNLFRYEPVSSKMKIIKIIGTHPSIFFPFLYCIIVRPNLVRLYESAENKFQKNK